LDFKRILIFRIGHLGDTLVSLPAFWAVKRAFPNAEISLLTNTDANNPNYIAAQNVLPKEGLFDKWLKYPTGLDKYKTIRAFKKLLSEIRSNNFDVVIYLMTRNRTLKQIKRDKLFFRLAGINKIIGLENLKINLIDLNQQKPLPKLNSELEFLLNCLSVENFPLGDIENLKPEMLLTEEEKQFAQTWLRENCGENVEKKKLIGIAPASKWDSKVWSEKRFIEVGQRLIVEKEIFPVIFGGKEDREKGNRLLEKWKTGANAAGKLNIRQAAAALANCQLYLGNDTGTMHLAASVGTPCVGIFAAIDYEGRWQPFGDQHQIFRKTVECEGCFSPKCLNNRKCLDLISTDEVYQACLNILKSERK
jgi:ADP-heptose:LPS heptosyltransferase